MATDESVAKAIAAVRQEHVDAVNSTDPDLLLNGFTDDVVYIGTGAPPILGKATMRTYIAAVYAQASIRIDMNPGALDVHGDRVVEWGSCRGEMVLDEGGPVPVDLNYILVYRREPSGEWRISHDISTPGPTG